MSDVVPAKAGTQPERSRDLSGPPPARGRLPSAWRAVDWTAPFDSIERAGEVRYVMITPKQAVAVFRDDALNATSIVAPRPPPAPLFDPAAFGL